MISFLSGIIKYIDKNVITLECAGVGFQINVCDDKLFLLCQKAELYIYFYWNQESGPALFGFLSPQARNAFSLIISCSGFGPKIGLAILATMEADQFFQSILLSDIKALSSVNGVGAKKAENMIMQLKDKVSKISPTQIKTEQNNILLIIKQVNEALASLHYTRAEISAALDYVKQNIVIENAKFDEVLRKALSFLAKKR